MSNFNAKVTKAGTQLPLLNLKGKPYLQVAHRLVWFREENPTGIIKTQMLAHQDGSALFKAEIFINNQLVSSAHKNESKENFGDYIEKAETGAIGRALAMAGYGTQFEPEFDEASRLADAPVDVATRSNAADINSGGTAATVNTNGSGASNTTENKVVRPTFKKKAKTDSAEDKI